MVKYIDRINSEIHSLEISFVGMEWEDAIPDLGKPGVERISFPGVVLTLYIGKYAKQIYF
jgi:hypothetical protein